MRQPSAGWSAARNRSATRTSAARPRAKGLGGEGDVALGRPVIPPLTSLLPILRVAKPWRDELGMRVGWKTLRVPEISRFYGIVIAMYYRDHAPPHFHARYGGAIAVIDLESGHLLEGSMPERALALVREWARLHIDGLLADWERARLAAPLLPIDPLR